MITGYILNNKEETARNIVDPTDNRSVFSKPRKSKCLSKQVLHKIAKISSLDILSIVFLIIETFVKIH